MGIKKYVLKMSAVIFFVMTLFFADDMVFAATLSDNTIHTVTSQSDGKIIVAGSFSLFNGVTRNRIARLTESGSVDTAFDSGIGANSQINSVAVQSDGKVLVGGLFTTYNNLSKSYIVRLNADGTLDSTFNTAGSGPNGEVKKVFVQSDGKLIVGGLFTTYNGITQSYIVRLNADGTLDSTFNTAGSGPNGPVSSAAIQSDGKILISGGFSSYNGTAKMLLARLNVNGSLDTGFNTTAGPNNVIYAFAEQADGKIVVGGQFTKFNNITSNYVTRLHSDGSKDISFGYTGTNSYVYALAVRSDGKIVIGGNFTQYAGVNRGYFARTDTYGAIDTGFNASAGANSGVTDIEIQPSGKMIIAGSFTLYNGAVTNRILRFNTDGSLDTVFGDAPLVSAASLTTQSATNITPTSATINAEITNTGSDNPERIIEYGTATNTYTQSCTQGTGSIGAYSCTISNLTPGTTYYYKAKATNSAGTSYGDEMSFTTQSLPAEVTIPNPSDTSLS